MSISEGSTVPLAVVFALWGGLAVWQAGAEVVPKLRLLGASRTGVVVGYLAGWVVPIACAATSVAVAPLVLPFVAAIPLLVTIAKPWLLVRMTGGALRPPAWTLVQRHIDEANQRLELGDWEGWDTRLRALRAGLDAGTAAYVRLWQRLADEEHARRSGRQVDSAETFHELTAARQRLEAGTASPNLAVTFGATLLAAIVAGAPVLAIPPPVASSDVCATANSIVSAAASAPGEAFSVEEPLQHITLLDPGDDATLEWDGRLTLEQTGEMRHDPTAGAQLKADGFQTAYLRAWATPDGRTLEGEVIEFATPEGAWTFQRSQTAYACRFSNLAFQGPMGAVGLQIRYGTGDPIREQVTWVNGSRRILVLRSFLSPPSGHGQVLSLAANAQHQLEHPHE